MEDLTLIEPLLSIGQIARYVKNLEKSEQWYRDTLGLDHLYTYGTSD